MPCPYVTTAPIPCPSPAQCAPAVPNAVSPGCPQARDVYEEAVQTVMTVRDFTQVFDSYAQFEESVIAAKMETMAELGREEDGEGDTAVATVPGLSFPPKMGSLGVSGLSFPQKGEVWGFQCPVCPLVTLSPSVPEPHPGSGPGHLKRVLVTSSCPQVSPDPLSSLCGGVLVAPSCPQVSLTLSLHP